MKRFLTLLFVLMFVGVACQNDKVQEPASPELSYTTTEEIAETDAPEASDSETGEKKKDGRDFI